MCRQLFVLSVAAGLSLMTSAALAQCGCGSGQPSYAPVAPSYTTYYTPTAAYCPSASNVTYYTPATQQAAYYAPAAQPYTAYYASAVQPYAVYYGAAGKSIYGTPKI